MTFLLSKPIFKPYLPLKVKKNQYLGQAKHIGLFPSFSVLVDTVAVRAVGGLAFHIAGIATLDMTGEGWRISCRQL